MEGLSSRSVVGNFICNIVIFIHLYDSGFTSVIVLISAAASTLIEGWKVTKHSASLNPDPDPQFLPEVLKVLKIRVEWEGFRFRFRMEGMSVAEEATDAFDATAVKTMGRSLYPLVIGGAIYSLVRES